MRRVGAPTRPIAPRKSSHADSETSALPHAARVTFAGERAHVQLHSRDKGLAPGQFAAWYDGDVCLGSGVISASSGC